MGRGAGLGKQKTLALGTYAQHDLMSQAVDGRIRGHVAVSCGAFAKMLIMKTEQGARAQFA